MPHYDLVQTSGADMPSRFSANGKRVSRAEFERITETALQKGALDCFLTKGKQMTGGRIRRKNYSCARWDE